MIDRRAARRPGRHEAARHARTGPTLKTVDVVTKEATVSFKERTDVTAVPAMGVVAETMVALVLAAEAQRKFGGDSRGRVRPQRRRPTAPRCDERPAVRVHLVAGRHDGVGQDDHRSRVAADRLGRPFLDSDQMIEARDGPHRARDLAGRRRAGVPARWRREVLARGARLGGRRSVIAAAGGVVLAGGEPAPARAATASCTVRLHAARRGAGGSGPQPGPPPAARRRPAGHPAPPDRRARRPLYREVADVIVEVATAATVDEHRRARSSDAPSTDRERELIRVPVPAAPGGAYDVWVGAGAATSWPTCCRAGDAGASRVVTQAGVPDRGRPRPSRRAASRSATASGQDAGHGRGAVPRLRPRRADPRRLRGGRRRRRRHRRRRLRRRGLPPGHRRRARADHAARAGRRRHRRQDRRQPAGGQEPGRRVLAAGRRAVRHRRAGHAARAGVPLRPRRDGQVPLPHRRRPARPAAATSGWPRCVAIKADGGGRRRARGAAGPGTGHPQLRPHPRPRPRDRRATTTCATARRSPSASSSPPSWRAALGRIDDGRASTSTGAWSAAYDLAADAARRRSDPDELVALMGRDKKAHRRADLRARRPAASRSVPGVARPRVDAALARMAA